MQLINFQIRSSRKRSLVIKKFILHSFLIFFFLFSFVWGVILFLLYTLFRDTLYTEEFWPAEVSFESKSSTNAFQMPNAKRIIPVVDFLRFLLWWTSAINSLATFFNFGYFRNTHRLVFLLVYYSCLFIETFTLLLLSLLKKKKKKKTQNVKSQNWEKPPNSRNSHGLCSGARRNEEIFFQRVMMDVEIFLRIIMLGISLDSQPLSC